MRESCAVAVAVLAAVLACSCQTRTQMEIISEGHFAPRYEGAQTKPAEPLTRFRGKCRMWLFADEGAQVTLHLIDSQVSSRYSKELRFSVNSPEGKPVLSGKLPVKQTKDFSFKAAAEGRYELRLDAQGNATQLTVDGARLCIPAADTEPCAVIGGSQKLWFYVPAASRRFQVLLRGQGTAETAAIIVCGPGGKEVKRGTTVGSDKVLLDVPVRGQGAGAIWSLQIVKAAEGVLEDASVALLGNVAPCVAQRPDDLVLPLMRVDMAGMYRKSEKVKMEVSGAILAPTSALKDPVIAIAATAGERQVFASTVSDVTSGDFHVELPRDKFPMGAYKLSVVLREKGQKQDLWSCEREFFVVDRPKNLRPDKVTLHNGKPFFARGLYHVNPEDYELVKKQGFNIVQAGPDNVLKCESAGINAAVALYWGMRLNPEYYREKIAAYRNNRAVVCWMIMDEPAGNKVPLDDIQRHYGIIREMDPSRPAYMCICVPGAYATYGLATDIIAIDVYPIREGTDDISSIWKTLDIAKRDVPDQTVWFIGQVWSWQGRTDPEKRRLVTAAEHRCMTYLALTHDNVRGLMWYSFRDPNWYLPKQNPEVWAACKKVNDELIALEPVLLESSKYEKTITGSGGLDIHLAMKEHGGAQYIIAVNPNYKPTDASIEAKGGEAEVMFENRKLKIESGAIKDKFDALAVHIYKVGK